MPPFYRSFLIEEFFREHYDEWREHRRSAFFESSFSWEFFEELKPFTEQERLYLAENKNIPESFFVAQLESGEVLPNYFFETLARREDFSEEFFERYYDLFGIEFLSRNEGLSLSFFERHLEQLRQSSAEVWCNLAWNPNISWEFIIGYLKDPSCFTEVDDEVLQSTEFGDIGAFDDDEYEFYSRHRPQDRDYFIDLSKKALLRVVCKNKFVPWREVALPLLKRYGITRWYWSDCQSLPERKAMELLDENMEKRDIFEIQRDIFQNEQYSLDFIDAVITSILAKGWHVNWDPVIYRKDLTWEFLEKYLTHFGVENKYLYQVIAQLPIVPIEFLTTQYDISDRHENGKLPLWRVLVNPAFNDETIGQFFDKLVVEKVPQNDLIRVNSNPSLTWRFFTEERIFAMLNQEPKVRHPFLVKEELSRNPNLSLQFFKDHPEIIEWRYLIQNPFTYQKDLENGFYEETAIYDAQTALATEPEESTPRLVLNIIRDEEERLQNRRFRR